VLRRIKTLALSFALLTGAGFLSLTAQAQTPQQTPAPDAKAPKPEKAPKQTKQFTPEQVAETVIFVTGTREGIAQVRRSGTERGRITRINAEGKTEEMSYERRFIRGESADKDRIRTDQKMPTAELALVYSGGQTWGIINDTVFTPREDAMQEFLTLQHHGIDTLLRYKENGSTLNYIGKEKQMGVDLYVLDVTDKEQRRTRFYISAKTGRVLSLEYEQSPPGGGAPAKYLRKFYDYRIAQQTWAPFRSVLYRDGKQIEETRILTITYAAKLDEAMFQNPNAPAATTNASRP
jgi:hypothetical protein